MNNENYKIEKWTKLATRLIIFFSHMNVQKEKKACVYEWVCTKSRCIQFFFQYFKFSFSNRRIGSTSVLSSLLLLSTLLHSRSYFTHNLLCVYVVSSTQTRIGLKNLFIITKGTQTDTTLINAHNQRRHVLFFFSIVLLFPSLADISFTIQFLVFYSLFQRPLRLYSI